MINRPLLASVVLLGLCAIFATPVFAGSFPTELFEIRIGGQYEIGPGDGAGDLPVKQITGTETTTIPWGFRKYFEPAAVDPAFPYKPLKNDPSESRFRTNYYIYAYPIIPETVTTAEQLREHTSGVSKWHVAIISWKDDKHSETDANAWARDMCATVAADTAQEPNMVTNHPEDTPTSHHCRFISDDMHTAIEVFNRGTWVYFKLIDHGRRGKILRPLMEMNGVLRPGPDVVGDEAGE